MFAVPEFRDYYEKGKYERVKVRNAMVKGLKFSKALKEFSL